MSQGVESVEIIEPWLFATLNGDATLRGMVSRVVGSISPFAVESPYVMFAMTSVRDVTGVGTARVMVDALYQVQAVAQSSSQADVAPIARRIDDLLHGKSVTTSSGSLTCMRRSIVSYGEAVQGVPWLHLGAVYHIIAHS